MMFFVTERRLQEIIEADRSQQRMAWERERVQALLDEHHRRGEIAWQAANRRRFAELLTGPMTPEANDAKRTAKKAATKAARPARKPREKK